MKKSLMRILPLVLMVILVASLAVPAFAATDISPNTGTTTYYLPASYDIGSSVRVEIARGNKNFTIKRSDVTVTPGTTDAKLTSFGKSTSISTNQYLSGSTWSSNSSGNYYYYIILSVTKTGTATVKYVINGTTYTTKVRILAYTNPVSLVQVTATGYKKTLTSLTKNVWYGPPATFPRDLNTVKIKVAAASGWRIKRVQFYNSKTGTSSEMTNRNYGMSSATLALGYSISASRNYGIYIEMENTSNKGTMFLQYDFNGANAS